MPSRPSLIDNRTISLVFHPSRLKPEGHFSKGIMVIAREHLRVMIRRGLRQEFDGSIRKNPPPTLVSHPSINARVNSLSAKSTIRPSVEETKKGYRNHTNII